MSKFLLSLFNVSDSEHIALVANYKIATMSESLSSLCKKEQHKWLELIFTVFHCFPPILCPRVNLLGRSSLSCSLSKNRREQFNLIALYKKSTMNYSLPLLFFISKSLFRLQKMSNLLEKLISKYLTLQMVVVLLKGTVSWEKLFSWGLGVID